MEEKRRRERHIRSGDGRLGRGGGEVVNEEGKDTIFVQALHSHLTDIVESFELIKEKKHDSTQPARRLLGDAGEQKALFVDFWWHDKDGGRVSSDSSCHAQFYLVAYL